VIIRPLHYSIPFSPHPFWADAPVIQTVQPLGACVDGLFSTDEIVQRQEKYC